jgi:hypothetical protein
MAAYFRRGGGPELGCAAAGVPPIPARRPGVGPAPGLPLLARQGRTGRRAGGRRLGLLVRRPTAHTGITVYRHRKRDEGQ